MTRKLTLRYDELGDILMIDTVRPYAEQDSDDLGDEIITRFHPATGDVENIEILFFMKRIRSGERFELPIDALLRPTAEQSEGRSSPGKSDQDPG